MAKVGVVRGLCAAALLALPHNLFLKLILPESYQNGLLIDYFIPKLFFSDFFLIPLALWAVFDLAREIITTKTLPRTTAYIAAALSVATIWTFFHGGFEVTWWWAGLVASFIVGRWLSQPWAKPVWRHWLLPTILTLTLVIQAVFANVQWRTQHSLTPYSFFGETNLSAPYSLLTITVDNVQKVLPYGTTPHPNILAGTAVVAWFLVFLFYKDNDNKKYSRVLLSAASLAALSILALTDSLSANLALLAAGFTTLLLSTPFTTKFLYLNEDSFKRKLISLLVLTPIILATATWPTISNKSVHRRLELQKIAITAIDQPLEVLFGTGWGGTLKHIAANPSRTNEIARFAQPTHHVPSLWSLETGLLGAAALWLFVLGCNSRRLLVLLILTPTLILDHYWLSSHHAWWLLFLALGMGKKL